LIKIIKEKIRKKEKFSKIKNIKSRNYLKIAKVLNKEIYVKEKVIKTKIKNITIKNVFTIINSNLRVIKY